MISQSRYVDITSGVGAGTVVSTRQYILRLITQSTLINPGIVYEYSSASEVESVFGSTSEEYKRASSYFAFISKDVRSPALISFYRWAYNAVAPIVSGDTDAKSLTSLQAVTAGELNLVSNGTAIQITAIDLSSATDLTDVASKIQAAIRLNSDTMLATATVSYNTNNNQFTLTGGVTGEGTLTVTVSSDPNEIAVLLGWNDATTSSGFDLQSPVEAVSASAEVSNNFATVVFCTPATALTTAQMVEIANWIDVQNVTYVYAFSATSSNAATLEAALVAYSGVAMNISADSADATYVDQFCAEVAATTDYDSADAVQDFMYQQSSRRTAAVTTDTLADAMDKVRGNYFGTTQTAGNSISFYQRGVLMGGSSAPVDMNVFYNEIWLKDYIAAQFLTAQLNLKKISANTAGKATLVTVLQGAVSLAASNGTISSGKTLTTTQQLYITQLTSDSNAWRQVQTNGYWYSVKLGTRTNSNSGLSESYASYTLIYGKDDDVRFIEGSDVLI